MKKMANFYCALALFALSTSVYAANPGEGKWVADEVYRSINSGGTTGLLYMNSAYTVGDGDFVINATGSTFDAFGVDYTTVGGSITYGISDRSELSLLYNQVDASVAGGKLPYVPEAEINYKWRFRNQSEYLPALSLMVGASRRTTDVSGPEENVDGYKINLLGASEARLSDTFFLGMYFDVGYSAYSWASAPTDPSYTEANFGLLFPISDNNKTQLIFEYNAQYWDMPTIGTYDLTGFSYGIRYASTGLKITLGGQSIDDSLGGSTNRVIGTFGYSF